MITGGAARYLAEAAGAGYDLFLTGEPAEPSLHTARELGIHFVAAGHYATERIGIQALSVASPSTSTWTGSSSTFPTPSDGSPVAAVGSRE